MLEWTNSIQAEHRWEPTSIEWKALLLMLPKTCWQSRHQRAGYPTPTSLMKALNSRPIKFESVLEQPRLVKPIKWRLA